ncbi:MAG: crotonase/enoyl-CoA hydratase family protein [Alphaproteobacteria bacterium]
MKIRIDRDGPVTVVTIDRKDVRNAVDNETALALREAFLGFDADATAKVAVFTGAHGHFCAGYDLKSLAGASLEKIYQPEGDGPMGPSRLLLSKPVIAAIEGFAVAGGLELALWCDLRVVAETATFGVFCRRWGVPLIDGGTVRLPRLVGQGRALDMILTGRVVGAREALDWGLANRVVPTGQAQQAAVELAEEIARFPELCMKTDRMSALRQWDFELAEALRFEGREGLAPLEQGAREGAGRFAGGKGRGGNFETI